MANLYSVGQNVKCQKLGGQSGTKQLTPEMAGTVLEVLPGGMQYRVNLSFPGGLHHSPLAHFKGGIVDEGDMTAA